MNNFSFGGPGGLRGRSEYVGGRPASDANYGAKKKFGDKKSFGGKKPGFGGKPGKFGGKPAARHGAQGDRPMTLHKATCSACGKACEVPFRPDGSKPVLCRECFAANPPQKREGGDRDRGSKRDSAPRAYAPAPSVDLGALTSRLTVIEAKLDTLTKLLAASANPAKKVVKEAVPADAVVMTVGEEVAPVAKKAAKSVVKKAAAKKALAKKTAKAAPKKAAKKKAK